MENSFSIQQKNDILNGVGVYYAILEFCMSTRQTFCASIALEKAEQKSGADKEDIENYMFGIITF